MYIRYTIKLNLKGQEQLYDDIERIGSYLAHIFGSPK